MESFALGAQVVGMKGCEDMKVGMDRAGYFVIIPQQDKGIITVERYSYDNRLLRRGQKCQKYIWTILKMGGLCS